MEKELNIAAILKEKPKETKLWSPMIGECELYRSHRNGICLRYNSGTYFLSQEGKYSSKGECVLFPSRNMRDWEKFAWQKGDVLTDNISTICLFDGWANDDYTEFKAKYTLHLISSNNAESEVCKTNNFVSVIKDEDKQSYLATAEKFFNVNLTKGSLEIEKPFKDGDIVVLTENETKYYSPCIFILKSIQDSRFYYHVFFNVPCGNLLFNDNLFDKRIPRPATDTEKQQLFDALDKEGKRWNPETLQIEDLPKKPEFKAFDKVLSRRCSEDYWGLNFYSHKTDYYHICIDGSSNLYCVPYNDRTAHLLGTTDEWKGGEG